MDCYLVVPGMRQRYVPLLYSSEEDGFLDNDKRMVGVTAMLSLTIWCRRLAVFGLLLFNSTLEKKLLAPGRSDTVQYEERYSSS